MKFVSVRDAERGCTASRNGHIPFLIPRICFDLLAMGPMSRLAKEQCLIHPLVWWFRLFNRAFSLFITTDFRTQRNDFGQRCSTLAQEDWHVPRTVQLLSTLIRTLFRPIPNPSRTHFASDTNHVVDTIHPRSFACSSEQCTRVLPH
jgi:hypothetical protein